MADLLPASDDEEDEDESNANEAPRKSSPNNGASESEASDSGADENDIDGETREATMDMNEAQIEESEVQPQNTIDQQSESSELPVCALSAEQQVVHMEAKPNESAPATKMTSLADVVLSDDESDVVELIE